MWHMGAPILIVVCKIFSCSMLTLSWGLWVLVPPPGIEPKLPALEAWTLSQWTTEEVPQTCSLEAINTHLLSHSSVKSEVQVQRGLSSCYLRLLQASQGVGRAAFYSREPEKESALSLLLMGYWFKSVPHSCRNEFCFLPGSELKVFQSQQWLVSIPFSFSCLHFYLVSSFLSSSLFQGLWDYTDIPHIIQKKPILESAD